MKPGFIQVECFGSVLQANCSQIAWQSMMGGFREGGFDPDKPCFVRKLTSDERTRSHVSEPAYEVYQHDPMKTFIVGRADLDMGYFPPNLGDLVDGYLHQAAEVRYRTGVGSNFGQEYQSDPSRSRTVRLRKAEHEDGKLDRDD